MGKRVDFEAERPAKRQKTSQPEDAAAAAAPIQPIYNARQLAGLLDFHQDAVPQLRTGLRSVKAFLETIAYAEDKAASATEQGILRDLIDSQRPSDTEQNIFPSLLQAWSYAADTNSEALLSAIPAHFALLFRIISTDIKLRDYGLRLGGVLLKEDHAKLIARGLSAAQNKEHLISPCLRLLIEITTFDGGSLAKQLNADTARKHVLDPAVLARNISRWRDLPTDPEEARRKPSVRTNAVRYLLANLKFQSPSVRSDILQSNVSRALFEHLKHDPLDTMKEIFNVVRTFYLSAPQIKPHNKARVLHERSLMSISGLLSLERRDASHAKEESPAQLALRFLKFACTTPDAGLLKASSWYPPGFEKLMALDAMNTPHLDLGLDGLEEQHKYKTKVPVRNTALAEFCQALRPYANALESDLLVEIFRAAPELVANHFLEKTSFAFDPKLTATWVGYSAFLFSTVSIPLPEHFGPYADTPRIPPPVSIVIESILPAPMTQKVLTRCLNQQTNLITFFAIRLLAVAFKKLQACLARFHEASKESGSLWEEASRLLLSEFTSRCPSMKDVIASWKQAPKDNILHREALLRLLDLYYQVTPQLALQEKFDASSALSDAFAELVSLHDVETDSSTTKSRDPSKKLQLIELDHIVQIARWSPDVRWFSKPSPDALSPCGSLLQILSSESEVLPDTLRVLLFDILRDHGILQQTTRLNAAEALLASLRPQLDDQKAVLEFLADALDRTVKRPIKYEDDIEELSRGIATAGPVSLLWATLVEQWPHASKDMSSLGSLAIAQWLHRYHHDSIAIGEDKVLLDHLLTKLEADTADKKARAFDANSQDLKNHQNATRHLLQTRAQPAPVTTPSKIQMQRFKIPLYLLPTPPSSSGLHTWSTHSDIPTAIQTGSLPPLISSLSSPYPEVRHQAYANIRTIHTRLLPFTTPTSSFSDGKIFYLFLGELIATLTPYFPQSSTPATNEQHIPGILVSYAALAAEILTQPLHPLYDKINTFHTRAPKWDASRLAAYWVKQTLREPAVDDTSYAPGANATAIAKRAELDFLLRLLFDSLVRAEDVETSLRRRGLLEPLLALGSSSPSTVSTSGSASAHAARRDGIRVREGILKILWRISLLRQGNTLATRAGVFSWLGIMISKLYGSGSSAGKLRQADEDEQGDVADEGDGDGNGGERRGREELGSEVGLRALGTYIWRSMEGQTGRWSEGGAATEKVIEDLMRGVELVEADAADVDADVDGMQVY